MARPTFITVSAMLAGVALALPDSNLINTTQIVWSSERTGLFVGSPTILRCANGSLLAAHDQFGAASGKAFTYRSDSNGAEDSWYATGVAAPMYWATLFSRSDEPGAVYLMGTSSDSSKVVSEVSLARSTDCGSTWNTSVLTTWQHDISTGPTPVIEHNGRLWRAYERNDGAWAAGYAAMVASAPLNAPDLLSPAAWTMSAVLDFSSVAARVPANWSSPLVASSFGWLEGNAVPPVNASLPGVNILLRVNSIPASNKAALLYVANASAAPAFVAFVDFPVGVRAMRRRRRLRYCVRRQRDCSCADLCCEWWRSAGAHCINVYFYAYAYIAS